MQFRGAARKRADRLPALAPRLVKPPPYRVARGNSATKLHAHNVARVGVCRSLSEFVGVSVAGMGAVHCVRRVMCACNVVSVRASCAPRRVRHVVSCARAVAATGSIQQCAVGLSRRPCTARTRWFGHASRARRAMRAIREKLRVDIAPRTPRRLRRITNCTAPSPSANTIKQMASMAMNSSAATWLAFGVIGAGVMCAAIRQCRSVC